MSKKKKAPKPDGYDELLGDLVNLIQQFKAKTRVKAKPVKNAAKNSQAPKRLPAKKPKGGQS